MLRRRHHGASLQIIICRKLGVITANADVYLLHNVCFELRRKLGVAVRCEFFGSFPNKAAIAIYEANDTLGKSYRSHFLKDVDFASTLEKAAYFPKFDSAVLGAFNGTSGTCGL